MDADATERPARFAFVLLIDEIIYEFSFAVTRTAVVEEKLVKITSDNEETLYSRTEKLKDQVLQAVLNGTRDNQLFLTNSVSQKREDFHLASLFHNLRLSLLYIPISSTSTILLRLKY